MTNRNKTMPLGELPDYVKSARDNGQSDVPVVEMGRIVSPNRSRTFLVAGVAACLFLSLIGVYAFNPTSEIVIVSSARAEEVADIVSEEGGRVLSVRRDEGAYKVRVFSLGMNKLIEGLRGNKKFDRVEQGD